MTVPWLRLAAQCVTRVLVVGCLAGCAALVAAPPAAAQVPPAPAQAARYEGLHAAAYGGQIAELEKLLASGTAPDVRDDYGRTPLHLATFQGHHDAIRALAKAGADLEALEKDRYDAVTIAAVADDEATLAVLLSLGASARLITSRYDGTALIAAAHLGNAGIVNQLIRAGAPLDHVNNLNWTAVIESIVLGDGGPRHQKALEALIRAGADLQLTDREGNTPLALARLLRYPEMIRLIEQAGAQERRTPR